MSCGDGLALADGRWRSGVPLSSCHLPVVHLPVVGRLLRRCYRLVITDMLMQAQTLVLQVFRGMVGVWAIVTCVSARTGRPARYLT